MMNLLYADNHPVTVYPIGLERYHLEEVILPALCGEFGRADIELIPDDD